MRIIFLLSIFCLSCSNFGSMNENPNASTTLIPSGLLANAIVNWGAILTNNNAFAAGCYCQYFSETQDTDMSRYTNRQVEWDMYNSPLIDLQNVLLFCQDNANKANASKYGDVDNQIAIARILKAYYFSYLTDMSGDIPYSQALQKQPTIVYDKQADIYNSLFDELKQAAAQLHTSSNTVQGDILFNGDITQWKKFANSWRLILALRLSKADAKTGMAQFNDVLQNKATNGGILETSTDDIKLIYPTASEGYISPWYKVGSGYNVSSTLCQFLNYNQDQRRFAYGNVVVGVTGVTDLVGMPSGLTRDLAIAYATANPNHSLILNDTYRKASSTLLLFSAAEVLLARAEAAVLKWTSEDYTTLYKAGIAESWKTWNVYDDTKFANYYSRDGIQLTGGTEIKKIATQRWIASYPNAVQGWCEWRRNNYPVLTPSPYPLNTTGQIPTRMVYPKSEYVYNAPNLADAVGRIDTKQDNQDGHVWWDK